MQENKQEFSPIKKRILQYIDIKDISVYKFYKESAITRGILAQSNGISEENIAKFLAYANDVNPSWLLTGAGEILLTSALENESIHNRTGSVQNSIADQLRHNREKTLSKAPGSNKNIKSVDVTHARKLNRILEKKYPDLYKFTVSLDRVFWFNDASEAIGKTLGEQVDNVFRNFKGEFDFKEYERNAVELLRKLAPFAPALNELGDAINKFYSDMAAVPGNTIDFESFIVE